MRTLFRALRNPRVMFLVALFPGLVSLYFPRHSSIELVRTQALNLFLGGGLLCLFTLFEHAVAAKEKGKLRVVLNSVCVLIFVGNLAPFFNLTIPDVALVDWNQALTEHGVPRNKLTHRLDYEVQFVRFESRLLSYLEAASKGELVTTIQASYLPYSGFSVDTKMTISGVPVGPVPAPHLTPFTDKYLTRFRLASGDVKGLLNDRKIKIAFKASETSQLLDSIYIRPVGGSATRADIIVTSDGSRYPIQGDHIFLVVFMFEKPDGTPLAVFL